MVSTAYPLAVAAVDTGLWQLTHEAAERRFGDVTDRALPHGARWLERFLPGLTPREFWGYVVWFSLAIGVFVPEVSAVGDHLPWRTISTTTGHLEREWHLLRLVVVGLIVTTVLHIVRYPETHAARYARPKSGDLGRTPGGRFSARPAPPDESSEIDEIGAFAYYVPVIAVVVAATAYSSTWNNPYYCSYVLYSLIATFFLIVPSALAYWVQKDVPFPTMYHAIRSLEGRFHFLAAILTAALVILMIHLTLYPWPNLDFG